jgi:riboflavin transporter FmnP
MTTLQWVLAALSVLTALSLIVEIIRDRQPGNVTFTGLVALEAGLVVQLVWGLVRVFDNHDGVSVAPYLGYLVGALLILPIGFLWSASEKSRSGTAVLLVAVLVLPVLFLRLNDLWAAHV